MYQFTNFVFDNSILEVAPNSPKPSIFPTQIWMAISNGGCIFCDPKRFSTARFLRQIGEYGLTHAVLFPGLVASFGEEQVSEPFISLNLKSQLAQMSELRMWIVGAEKAAESLIHSALRLKVSNVATLSTLYLSRSESIRTTAQQKRQRSFLLERWQQVIILIIRVSLSLTLKQR